MSPRSVILGVADPVKTYLSKTPKLSVQPEYYRGLYQWNQRVLKRGNEAAVSVVLALGCAFIFIYFSKIHVWTHDPSVGAFGGSGPSPNALKQKYQNDLITAKLLGTSLKDFEGF